MASLENRQKTIEALGLWLMDCDSHPPQLWISQKRNKITNLLSYLRIRNVIMVNEKKKWVLSL